MSMNAGRTLSMVESAHLLTSDSSLSSPREIMLALRSASDDVGANAMRAIQSMTSNNRTVRNELLGAGVVEQLVDRLAACDSLTRVDVIRSLYPLSLDVRAHAKFIPTNIVPLLLGFLLTGKPDSGESSESLRLLQCLLVNPLLRLQLVQLDGISTLTSIAFSGEGVQRDRAVFVLWMLAATPAFQSQFTKTKALDALVCVLEECSGDSIDVALSAMVLLSENDDCREVLVAHDLSTTLRDVVQTEARDEVTYRAQLLAELLQLPSSP